MKIIECPWELSNLDRRVVEIFIDNNESIDKHALSIVEKSCDYLVVKLQPCNTKQYIDLASMGYNFIENQITVEKDIEETEDRNKLFSNNDCLDLFESIRCVRVTNQDELKNILNNMTVDQFVTDRIYLDNEFGKEYSVRRYKNWIQSEFDQGTNLFSIIFKNQDVGFVLCTIKDSHMRILLWGLYERFQHRGLGDIVPLSAYCINDNIEKINSLETKISSNNKGIISKLNKFNYRFSHFEYVFVKHIKTNNVLIEK